MTINYFIIFPTAVFPGHTIWQLRNNYYRLRSGVARGECDNTLARTLHFTGLLYPACNMPSFAPCLHEEADTRIFARAKEAAKRPNKKISSCAVDTDVVLVIPMVQWSAELAKIAAIVGVKSKCLSFFIHSQGVIKHHFSLVVENGG